MWSTDTKNHLGDKEVGTGFSFHSFCCVYFAVMLFVVKKKVLLLHVPCFCFCIVKYLLVFLVLSSSLF